MTDLTELALTYVWVRDQLKQALPNLDLEGVDRVADSIVQSSAKSGPQKLVQEVARPRRKLVEPGFSREKSRRGHLSVEVDDGAKVISLGEAIKTVLATPMTRTEIASIFRQKGWKVRTDAYQSDLASVLQTYMAKDPQFIRAGTNGKGYLLWQAVHVAPEVATKDDES